MRLLFARVRARVRAARRFAALAGRNPMVAVGGTIILLFGVAALVYPLLIDTVWRGSVYNPVAGFDPSIVHPSSMSARHLLGTDDLGRDVLSMLLAASRPVWVLSITAAVTTALFAVAVGSVGALFRGWVDGLLSHVSDGFLLLPAPIFVLIVAEQVDLTPTRFGVIYGLITGLGAGAIVLRSQALRVMAEPFIDAARVAGAGRMRILVRHLVPHLVPMATLYMMLSVVGVVVAHGFAAYLGQAPSEVSWGGMVYYGITFGRQFGLGIPWTALLAPALALSLFAGGFYMVSAGLREVLDPRLRAR